MVKLKQHFVFDLDDTLYSEMCYVRSALEYLGELVETTYGKQDAAHSLLHLKAIGDKNPVQTLWKEYDLPQSAMNDCITSMRAHLPKISLRNGARSTLQTLKAMGIKCSILTDGRSLTQRRKIAALELEQFISGIYVSEERNVEKPDERAFLQIQSHFTDAAHFLYIGDNPIKDFIAPNKLGWTSIMLIDPGENVHPQSVDCTNEMQAQFKINNISEILDQTKAIR